MATTLPQVHGHLFYDLIALNGTPCEGCSIAFCYNHLYFNPNGNDCQTVERLIGTRVAGLEAEDEDFMAHCIWFSNNYGPLPHIRTRNMELRVRMPYMEDDDDDDEDEPIIPAPVTDLVPIDPLYVDGALRFLEFLAFLLIMWAFSKPLGYVCAYIEKIVDHWIEQLEARRRDL
ncbi:hypothetical protein BJY01DRAFT_250561 [Aspergillus pseudoustus]|uniref:Uncharacterized protein n=1 Tax=Aspergillus pseudoustus TaxID=1810923 RepID=A0ABR4JHQ2_9EURO